MSAVAPAARHVLSNWTKEQDEDIRRMARDGKSASEIALAVGKSRSAVLGRAWRKGIKMGSKLRPGQNSPDPKAFIRPHDKPGKRARVAPTSPQRAKPPSKDSDGLSKDRIDAAFNPANAPSSARKVTLLELEPGMCKWPLFTDSSRIFCGALIAHGASGGNAGDGSEATNGGARKAYCSAHAALARNPRQSGNGM